MKLFNFTVYLLVATRNNHSEKDKTMYKSFHFHTKNILLNIWILYVNCRLHPVYTCIKTLSMSKNFSTNISTNKVTFKTRMLLYSKTGESNLGSRGSQPFSACLSHWVLNLKCWLHKGQLYFSSRTMCVLVCESVFHLSLFL